MAIYYDTVSQKRYGKNSLAKAGLSSNLANVHELIAVPPIYDILTQQYSDSNLVEEKDGVYFVVYNIEDRDLDEAKKDMKEVLAKIRYKKEISGTETADGIKIITDRESQSSTNSVYNALANGIITSTQWKSPTGWILVTATELLPIVTALNEHVSKCFIAEQIVSAAIDAASDGDELRQINLNADFDTAYSA